MWSMSGMLGKKESEFFSRGSNNVSVTRRVPVDGCLVHACVGVRRRD